MNPTFGSGIRDELFTNVNRENTSSLEVKVATELRNYFPNLAIIQLSITPSPDSNMISLSINFKVKETQVEDEVTINFE